MPTTVKLLEHSSFSILLWNAICAKVDVRTDSVKNKFKLIPAGGDTTGEVKVTVNGVEVDVVESLVKFVGQMQRSFDQSLEDKAKELLGQDQMLSDLQQVLDDAKWKITDRIAKLIEEDKE